MSGSEQLAFDFAEAAPPVLRRRRRPPWSGCVGCGWFEGTSAAGGVCRWARGVSADSHFATLVERLVMTAAARGTCSLRATGGGTLWWWVPRFLEELQGSRRVAVAADLAGASRSSVYKLAKRNAVFRALFESARRGALPGRWIDTWVSQKER